MNLIRTGILTGISTAIRIAAGFVVNKVVAVIAGPAGLTLIGQVQNVSAISQQLSSGLFGNAAVKYSAQWRDQPVERDRFLQVCTVLAVVLSGVVGVLTMGASYSLAHYLLSDGGLWWVFALLGLLLPAFAVNNLVLSAINGLGDIQKLTLLSIGQSVAGLAISVGLPWFFGVPGALASVVLVGSVVFVLLLPELKRHPWLRLTRIQWTDERDNLRRIGEFVLMAVVVAVCAPVAQIALREMLMHQRSEVEAGFWQAMQRLSSAYLVFFTTVIGTYFLPKLSQVSGAALRKEVTRGYLLLLPSLILLALGVWLVRMRLIPFLYSEKFLPITPYIWILLLADSLKIGGWLMGSLMLAKARAVPFAIAEVVFNGVMVMTCWLVLRYTNLPGHAAAAIAYLTVYSTYLPVTIWIMRAELFGKEN